MFKEIFTIASNSSDKIKNNSFDLVIDVGNEKQDNLQLNQQNPEEQLFMLV